MSGTAPGVWTVDQAMQKVKDGAWPQQPINYIDDVFSTFTFDNTNNSYPLTLNSGIDMTKGGMFVNKGRTYSSSWEVGDSVQSYRINFNASSGGLTKALTMTSTGVTITGSFSASYPGPSVGYFFRKQPKFFDCVSWTGNGVDGRSISHALGSTPGCVIVKNTSDNYTNWHVWHRSLPSGYQILFNDKAPQYALTSYSPPRPSISANSTSITVGGNYDTNGSTGATYVAYIFAHDAGGFGVSGTENVISCGSYTGNGSPAGPSINLGWEPQWLMIKRTDADTGDAGWYICDNLRGMPVSNASGQYTNYLIANHPTSENNYSFAQQYVNPTATGFTLNTGQAGVNASGGTYIYVAIRRSNKVPTTGTQVYKPVAYTGTGSAERVDFGFPVDAYLHIGRSGSGWSNLSGYAWPLFTRLLGVANAINTTMNNTWSGGWGTSYLTIDNNYGVRLVDNYYLNVSNGLYSIHGFKRAPGFMDIVAYDGSGSTSAVNHGLGVQPELIIYKSRSNAANWVVHTPTLISQSKFLFFNNSDPAADNSSQGFSNSGAPTATTITPGSTQLNMAGWTYVAYLFATCPGVSKVGSYTGTGAAQTIDCGFTSGARFVLIKRTDSSGDWIMYDTARGIVSGNDPYIRLNSTGTEVTGFDYISPQSSGFGLTASAPAALNASGGTYIYLAIA
jgi:hypothetical protein